MPEQAPEQAVGHSAVVGGSSAIVNVRNTHPETSSLELTQELLDYARLEAKQRNVDVAVILQEELAVSNELARLNITERMLDAAARRSAPSPELMKIDETCPF